MNYQQAIDYLESFVNYEKINEYLYKDTLKLERIKSFLAKINNPQNSLNCIHIAGSKGKGSVCAFVSYILKECGYKVGLYTSPHLSDFRERIRILDQRSKIGYLGAERDFEGMIPKRDLLGVLKKLKPVIDKFSREPKYGPLTFFELYTALAFVYFKNKNVDFAVLETGLGGRLDATNIVNSLVCAITPISYDHMQKLGNTLAKIAKEKAGIIKSQKSKVKSQRLIVLSAKQEKEAGEVIRSRCNDVGARLYEVGRDILYKKEDDCHFKIKGLLGSYSGLKINLLGEHQISNAALAVGIIEALKERVNIKVSIDRLRNGLYNTRWPGRCEVVRNNPVVILDGAQNAASANEIKNTLKANFKYKKLILVLGISQDKDIKGVCRQLKNVTHKVILTKADNPRAISPVFLEKYFPKRKRYTSKTIKDALDLAFNITGTKDLILITGSLFTVAEARELLKS